MPRQRAPFVIDMPSPESISSPTATNVEWLDSAVFCGMLALLVFGPLAFGATLPWAQFVQRTAALLLLALWTARQYRTGTIEVLSNPLLLPAVALFALAILQFVSGWTTYRYATLTEGLNLIPSGILILIAGEVLNRRSKLREFVIAMSVFGFLLALFAIVQDLSSSDKIYWLVKPRGVSAFLYGPYANHNHYAGLMEMLVPLAGAAAFLERGGKRMLLVFATALMALSIVFSRSRGGMLGLAVSLIFVCALLFRINRRGRAALGVISIAVLVLVLTLFLASDKVLQHMTETQDYYRLSIYRDCLSMWQHKPLLGFGWGTFPTVYPAYRSFFTDLRVNHAHNDYLELLVETGIVGVVLMGWFLFGVFRQGFRKIFDREDFEGSVLAIGVLASIVAILAHSLLDFNLHIPANAALFFSLCAAAAVPYKQRIRQLEFTAWESEPEAIEVDSE